MKEQTRIQKQDKRGLEVLDSPVGGEDDGAPLFNHAVDAVPEGAAGLGVHAGGGLVL